MGWVGSGGASPGGGDGVASREWGHLSSRSVPRQGTGQVKPEGLQWVPGGSRAHSGCCGFWEDLGVPDPGLELSRGSFLALATPGVPSSGPRPSLVTWSSLCCLGFLTCKVGVSAVLTSQGHVRVRRVGGPVNGAERMLEPRGRRGPDGGTGSPGTLSAHRCPVPPPTRGLCSAAGLCLCSAQGWTRLHGESAPGALGGQARTPAPGQMHRGHSFQPRWLLLPACCHGAWLEADAPQEPPDPLRLGGARAAPLPSVASFPCAQEGLGWAVWCGQRGEA